MAKFIQTENGYKTRVYLGEELAGHDEKGKPVYRKFIKQVSARTQQELKRKVAELKTGYHKDPKGTTSFGTAAAKYIEEKENVLSPATVESYENSVKRLEKICPWFMSKDIHDISKADRQRVVSELSAHYALNTVKTFNTLIASIMGYNDLPSYKLKFNDGGDTTSEQDKYIPDEDTIRSIIEECRGTDLEPAILLAALGPLRRGEIGGLTWEDFDFENNTVNVCKAQVYARGEYIIKAPKTRASKRILEYPGWVMKRIREHDEILPMNIDLLTQRFAHFLKQHGYRRFRFHDLRHFAASYYLAEGLPEASVQRRGGWATDNMMKTVYRHELNRQSVDRKFLDSMNKLR